MKNIFAGPVFSLSALEKLPPDERARREWNAVSLAARPIVKNRERQTATDVEHRPHANETRSEDPKIDSQRRR